MKSLTAQQQLFNLWNTQQNVRLANMTWFPKKIWSRNQSIIAWNWICLRELPSSSGFKKVTHPAFCNSSRMKAHAASFDTRCLLVKGIMKQIKSTQSNGCSCARIPLGYVRQQFMNTFWLLSCDNFGVFHVTQSLHQTWKVVCSTNLLWTWWLPIAFVLKHISFVITRVNQI